jgi:hypothetical protein
MELLIEIIWSASMGDCMSKASIIRTDRNPER